MKLLEVFFVVTTVQKHECELVLAAGLSRPGKSRDRTGPRDLEGPVVPWSQD